MEVLRDELGHLLAISNSPFTACACLPGLVTGELYRAFLLSVAPWTPGLCAVKKGRSRLHIHSSSWCSGLAASAPSLV